MTPRSYALMLVCGLAVAGSPKADGGAIMVFRVTSSSFEPGAEIPAKHTCDGRDLSPPLAWSSAPEGTKSFALIVDDPDAPDPRAPRTTWVHWVLYDIPADVASLPEGLVAARLPAGAREGENDFRALGYRGPCPPYGRHRYFHKVYALDTVLRDLHRPDKPALERSMAGHVLGEAILIGTYAKRE